MLVASSGTRHDASPAHPLRHAVRSLFALPNQGSPRWEIATRAALSIVIPLGVLTLLGHQEIGLQTTGGTFTALYAAQRTARELANVLPLVILLLVCCGLCGVLLAPSQWGFAVGLVAIATLTPALCFAFRLGPPGPVFFVLVYGLASSTTGVVDGERVGDPVVFLLAMLGGALFAYVLTIAPLLFTSIRSQPTEPLRELLPSPWFDIDERLLVTRIALTSAVGTVISTVWLDSVHAYWTVCACVALAFVTPLVLLITSAVSAGDHGMMTAVERVVDTALGAALAATSGFIHRR